jgi:uncharacterized membrane protein YbaN (DUF454 family)
MDPTRSVACDVGSCLARLLAKARLKRWVFAALGAVCFGLGIVGAIVPGLPTAIFLIVGSYFLTRSCPWIEERLRAIPILKPYTRYLDPTQPMSRGSRVKAIGAMWISIVVTVVFMLWADTVPMAVPVAVVAAGAVGTVAIVRFRRDVPRDPATNP